MKLNTTIILLFTILLFGTSCSKEDNEVPEINIKNITIKGLGKSIDNLHIGDTVIIDLNLQSNKKELTSFSCKYKDINNFVLTIKNIDPTTTSYEGNEIATSANEDCTITFKDGTYTTDITVATILQDNMARTPQLNLYLFSKKETAIVNLDFKISYKHQAKPF